jgi:uncharacterized RDD family membrane protein YckC
MDTPREPEGAPRPGEEPDPHTPDPRDDPVFRDPGESESPSFGPGSPGYGPGADPGQQSPAGPGPQSPAGPGPQSPPGQPWTPPGGSAGPQAPTGPGPQWAPPAGQYGGPVPPGGWQQPPQAMMGVPPGQLAGWGSRAVAYLLDGLIIWVPALILMAIFGVGIASSDEGDAGFVAFVGALILTFLIVFVIALIYAPLLMIRKGQNNGQTWGKQIVGIRVIRTNGQPFNFSQAALREVVVKTLAVGIASSFIPIVPYLLNFLWPLWDDQNQALHDMACSTRVVRA